MTQTYEGKLPDNVNAYSWRRNNYFSNKAILFETCTERQNKRLFTDYEYMTYRVWYRLIIFTTLVITVSYN